MAARRGKRRRRPGPGAAEPKPATPARETPSGAAASRDLAQAPPDRAGRQGALLQLQRTYGNRRARALVGGQSTLQRDVLEQPVTGLGTPLVGLKRGDGLVFGTFDKREQVMLLQTKLNEKMMANIHVDGMFGPRTEEVLGEFQESVDRPSTSVVDQETADLLMSEGEPVSTPGPGGELPHPRLVSAGNNLNLGAIFAGQAGMFLSAAGNTFSVSFNNSRSAAGSALIAANGPLTTVSGHLSAAGAGLAVGNHVGIRAAGEELAGAAQFLRVVAIHLTAAGTALQFSTDPAFVDPPAGNLIIAFADQLPVVADRLDEAAAALEAHAARRTAVGDPIVGLKRGDGLIFGTFNRRDRVRLLQEKLNAKTGAGLAVDGMFGPLTTAALQNFQVSAGLPPTERVDSPTAKALRDADTGGAGLPINAAGAALNAANDTLVTAVIQLNLAGAVLMSGGTLENTTGFAAGQMLQGAATQFEKMGASLGSAGDDLAAI